MGFSRQEYWSGLPFPSPADLPDPGKELACLMFNLQWQAGSLPPAYLGSPKYGVVCFFMDWAISQANE